MVSLGASHILFGQAPDTRLDDAVKEIALLKRTMADQDRRIGTLEGVVRSQQRAILTMTARPASGTSSRTIEGWAAIKMGMSRVQVVEILGEPKLTEVVIDRQTLLYKEANGTPLGQVVITDDRVSEVSCPKFQIYLPAQK